MRRPGPAAAASLFSTSKRDKRTIRHSRLLNRIETATARVRKQRRPSRKLVTDLQSLGEALPDVGSSTTASSTIVNGTTVSSTTVNNNSTGSNSTSSIMGSNIGSNGTSQKGRQASAGSVLNTSLSTRPGARKRREKLHQWERELFQSNIDALMAVGANKGSGRGSGRGTASKKTAAALASTTAAQRWAHLRDFLEARLEQEAGAEAE